MISLLRAPWPDGSYVVCSSQDGVAEALPKAGGGQTTATTTTTTAAAAAAATTTSTAAPRNIDNDAFASASTDGINAATMTRVVGIMFIVIIVSAATIIVNDGSSAFGVGLSLESMLHISG